MNTTISTGILSQEKYQSNLNVALHTLKKTIAQKNDREDSPFIFLSIPEQADKSISMISRVTAHWIENPPDIVLLVGIGGSSAGTLAVYHALHHHLPSSAPQLWCADTIDPISSSTLATQLQHAAVSGKKIAPIIISKSGTTLETCANAAIYLEILKQYSPESFQHMIVITDTNSPAHQWAHEHGWQTAPIPAALGGRFSVFSAVGLIPLSLLGIDISALLAGAQMGTEHALRHNSFAIHNTTLLMCAQEEGFAIQDTFVATPQLALYGAWYRQLLAESLGKRNIHGKSCGITPTTSIIAQDLHSVAQLYLAGPHRTITNFVEINCRNAHEIKISAQSSPTQVNDSKPKHGYAGLRCQPGFPSFNAGGSSAGATAGNCELPLANRSVKEIHTALCTSIQQAYVDHQLPFLQVKLDPCGAEMVGVLMATAMISIVALGDIWQVNPFDQPQVGEYKKKALKLLSTL